MRCHRNRASLDLPMTTICEVLEILNDGKWHKLDEIQKEKGLSKGQVRRIIEFLKQYEFVKLDKMMKKVRIEDSAREFMMRQATS